MKQNFILVTCEHGGNRIPARYRPLFAFSQALLESHRGYDPGALKMAQELADALKAPLYYSKVSRLLVDLNRSRGHAGLYSKATKLLPPIEKREILEQHYLPYRTMVENRIARMAGRGKRIIHISSHSFTPELNGQIRNNDIGLLYDPKRPDEALVCRQWQKALIAQAPGLKVRMNYPYSGAADGFTAALRKKFSPDTYLGIELEINQRHLLINSRHWRALRRTLTETLKSVVNA